jgi:hypothetical protein
VPGPIIPTPLDHLGSHPFSFYPAILNIEHNEWRYIRATSSDIQVINTKTHAELWVPRRFVGEISLVGEPVMIVGLVKELEYREGAVFPHVRRVIEMPRAVNGPARSFEESPFRNPRPDPQSKPSATVVGIRIESRRESRAGRIIFGTVAAGLLACLAAAIVFRDTTPGPRGAFLRAQVDVPFTASDTYASVTAKFGAPSTDEARNAADFHYRRLWYSRRGLAVILVEDRYAGAIDGNGRVLRSVSTFNLRNLR